VVAAWWSRWRNPSFVRKRWWVGRCSWWWCWRLRVKETHTASRPASDSAHRRSFERARAALASASCMPPSYARLAASRRQSSNASSRRGRGSKHHPGVFERQEGPPHRCARRQGEQVCSSHSATVTPAPCNNGALECRRQHGTRCGRAQWWYCVESRTQSAGCAVIWCVPRLQQHPPTGRA
jgi:hypothetical protein